MNNDCLQMKSKKSQIRTTSEPIDQSLHTSLIHNTNQNSSVDLTDVSILSVDLRRYQHHDHGMLTDDDEDNEIVETSDDDDDDDDDDDEDDESLPSRTCNALLTNKNTVTNNNDDDDDMDFGLIDPDTQAKLTAILEATGITNSPIPEDFWRDQQVVRLLTSSVANNLNGLHEIANALSPSNVHQDKKSKSITKDTSSTFIRACVNNDLRTVEKLLQTTNGKEHFNDVNEDGDSVLALACSNGYTDLVQLLLTTIPDIDIDDRGTKQDCTPLMEACNAGHYDIVELLLKHNANVNIQSTSGNTALHYSAGGGYADIVRLLLEHGAKVEETNENGHTPLMEAASGGHVEVARALLDYGAGVNTHSNDAKDKNGNDSKQHKTDEMHTALMEACMDGHVQVAKLLLDHGADVNMPPDSYESPLTLSACGGHIELASLLIERGANLEEVNDEGYTPLMEASREGHDDLVNLLVTQGADVNRTTEDQQETALTLACAGGFIDVAKILITHGANVNLGQSTPLMEASQEGHLELVQYLLDSGANVKQLGPAGETALSYACEGDHREVVELLLNSGASIDQIDNEGRTPLMKAVRAGHISTVQYLISKGVDVNRSTNSKDSTVLSLACAGGHLEIASLLLKHGADPNHILKDRSNCLIEAAKGGHTEIVKLLLEYPKSVTQRKTQITSVEPLNQENNEQSQEAEQGNTLSNPFPSIPGDKKKHVPDNILNVLQTEDNTLSNNDQSSLPVSTDQTNAQLQILEHLQHVGKELHDKTEQQLQINQEYRQQANDYINSNPTSSSTTTGKKKRTTSSSSTSSSSSRTSSSSSTTKHDEQPISCLKTLSLPIPPQTINFFSTSVDESNSSSSLSSNKSHLPLLHHNQHHSKIKKSFHRQSIKNDRRLEQHMNDHQNYSDDMSGDLKNSKSLSSNDTTKISMQINTDTQKALEHLRGLAKNPSKLERMQTLKNNPDTIQEIRKVANQSFTDQLKTLPPFIPQLINDSLTLENKLNTDNLEQKSESNSPIQTVIPLNSNSSQRQSSTTRNPHSSIPVVNDLPSSSCQHSTCCHECPSQSSNLVNPNLSHLRFQNRIDVDCETESNHDTALTLSCAGGHDDLVTLLLQRGANIEHRDKKGFTPLILAATAGHATIVVRLLEHGALIEAQSERTKDTALSLACSGGRQEVVEVLLKKGANREHRNVSDYTALSLAASGGYVNIIRLLLNYGAEINSRTGSKLGITPLMLASMNGHVAVVKLLLDMGADINAQIETNRNTALTLACFQGRAEVVSLLVDRKANIEHRAKTGLTPLMESASGGYVDVGRVLLEHGADVNAPPVPTSKDTGLTIAADKGHHKFVELLLLYDVTIDVRNKKGATPLWLACNNGHLEVVQLLITRGANSDSSDSRKVTCLMAAFRKGHTKVIKYLVRQVRQFPSDADCRRLINTITDKDLLKKCQACMDQIISAKERQAAEANKAANSLLKEIDLEKSREETRKVAAAKKREKRKAKKKGKQKSSTTATTTKTDEEQCLEVEEEEEQQQQQNNENDALTHQETPVVAIVDQHDHDDDLRLKLIKITNNKQSIENKSPSPEPLPPPAAPILSKPSVNNSNNNKKKTNTMTRKIERHQENLALKNKQQETNSTPSGITNTDDGWQEVIGKQKKITIPHEQYSRVIGRSGSNLNVLREVTGASIEVENKRGIGDKTILIKGNADSIKHAHQLIMALLKNSESELMNLLPSSNEHKTKSKSNLITSNQENHPHHQHLDDEPLKTQRTNSTTHGPKLQNTESSASESHISTPNNARSSNNSTKKPVTTNSSYNSTHSTSSSSFSTVKTSQPLTTTGATWVNSNRSNRGISSSTTPTTTITNSSNNSITIWNHQQTSNRSVPNHNKISNSPSSSSSSYHYTYSNTNNYNHYGHSNKQTPSSSSPSNKHHSTNYHQKTEHSTPSGTASPPTQPGHRISLLSSTAPNVSSTSSSESVSPPPLTASSSSSLLVVSSATPTPTNVTTTGGYNPFASNILTTSLVGVLTKPKESISSTDEFNPTSTTKMNFANVAKMNVPSKASHHEPIQITMDESSSPLLPDPKAAPGYRGPLSNGTIPIHNQQQQQPSINRPTNYGSLSPTSQLSRAPGANRHQQAISPSISKVFIDQNGQTGSSTASSTSSSPSSMKQQTTQFIQPQQLFTTTDQQEKPYGPIGSHRTQIPTTADVTYNGNPLQIRTKFNRTLSANNTPTYRQPTAPSGPAAPPPPPMMLNNPAYANMSRSRSNLNPSAPEFQQCNRLPPPPQFIPPSQQTPISNGPLSANIMNIARMMEQKQQQQQLYPNNSNVPIHPPPPPPLPSRPLQQTDMEAMQQHVQNQVLHYWRLHANQQPLVPPPQLPTTLQIANILASKGQLPQDLNQAAALVAAYYYTNFLSRTPQPPSTITSNIPLSPNVNKNVYETMSAPPPPPSPMTTNNNEISSTAVDPTNGQIQTPVIVEPNVIIANSNHSTGPSSSSSTNVGSDHKMTPAAIGSERKRHMPIPINNSNDWSSSTKQSYPIDPYLQQQQQVPLSSEYQQVSRQDYPR